MKKFLWITPFLLAMQMAPLPKSRAELLLRQWIMVSMEIDGTKFTEEAFAQKRAQGRATVMQFLKGGTSYVKIYTNSIHGRAVSSTKRNSWKLNEEETQLIIKSEDEPTPQVFNIVKLTAKKMVLAYDDKGTRQVFYYDAYSEK
ncbi:MAG: hypothetical protein HC913_03030 [Microscillaceae bacterium]|nr:hypothetical protein [Microscillaceae bacterium]